MSRYDHKIETSLEGIEHLSKEKKQKKVINMKEKNLYYLRGEVVRFLISPKTKGVCLEANKIIVKRLFISMLN